MDFIVRPTIAADLSAVDALLARAYPKLLKADYPPSVLVTALPIISRARPELLTCGTYYVAVESGPELGGRILGAGGWTWDRKAQGLGHIRHVVTDDRAVRRGVGRAVVSHALDMARRAGVQRLECWSTRTAAPFYGALGFRDLGPMDITLQQGIIFPAVRMQLNLSEKPVTD